jgi:F0F1-type ATP synthase assembly protein I
VSSKSSESKDRKQSQNIYAIYAGLGMTFSTEILVLTLVGWWLGLKLDAYLGKKDLFAYLGLLAFFILALVHVIRTLLIMQKKLENEDSAEEKKEQ